MTIKVVRTSEDLFSSSLSDLTLRKRSRIDGDAPQDSHPSSATSPPVQSQETCGERAVLAAGKAITPGGILNYGQHFRSLCSLLVTPLPPSPINFIHGIRVLGMLLVHQGHVISFYFMFTRFSDMLKYVRDGRDTFFFKLLNGGWFAVDTFFFFAGFLLALRAASRAFQSPNPAKSFIRELPSLIVRRYLRLVGPLALILALNVATERTFVEMLPDPAKRELQQVMADQVDYGCWRTWPQVLFMTNNNALGGTSVPRCLRRIFISSRCIAWTWSLANEWQFFLSGCALLALYFARRRTGVTAILALCAASSVIAYRRIAPLNYPISSGELVDFFSNHETDHRLAAVILAYSPATAYFENFYISPFVRIQPYLLGLLAGLWVAQRQERVQTCTSPQGKREARFSIRTLSFLILIVAVPLILIFLIPSLALKPEWAGLYANRTARALYHATARLLWSLSLGGLVVTSVSQSQDLAWIGKVLGRLLDGRLFAFLSELSYSFYLVHPIILYVLLYPMLLTGLEARPSMPKISLLSLLSFGISLLSAVALYVCVEAPSRLLGKALALKTRHRKPLST